MKRMLLFLAVGLGLLAVGSAAYLILNAPRGQVNAANIFMAVHQYTLQMQMQGQPAPDSVKLKELLARGLLKESDVSAFAGLDVTVFLNANVHNPQSVLMSARLADGGELVLLTDGSVQSRKP